MTLNLVRQFMRLRASLRWLLLGSLAASAWVLLEPAAPIGRTVESAAWSLGGEVRTPTVPVAIAAQTLTARSSDPQPVVEAQGHRWSELTVTDFDPFVGPVVAAPRPTPTPAQPVAAPLPPPAPAPVRPSLDAKFAGRLVDPQGRQIVYLKIGEQAMAVSPGSTLPGGFVVAAVTARDVQIQFQADPTQAAYTVAIPSTAAGGQ